VVSAFLYRTAISCLQDLKEIGEVFKELQLRFPRQRVMLVTTEKVCPLFVLKLQIYKPISKEVLFVLDAGLYAGPTCDG
jgi:hypothetical protein